MITCIILSAGESSRFGSPKALAPLGATTVLGHIQDNLLATTVDEIIVVLGAHLETLKHHVFNHNKVRLVYNKNFKLGQTSSFQAGISAVAAGTTGVLLLPVDCPMVKPSTMDALLQEYANQKSMVLLPVFQGQRGHPPLFNAALKQEILDLPTDSGINTLFSRHTPQLLEVNDPGILKSFNTPEEFKHLS